MRVLRVIIPLVLFVTICIVPARLQAATCTTKAQGDSNCDGVTNLSDFEIFRKEFTGILTTTDADFNSDQKVTLVDFEIWRTSLFSQTATPSISPSLTPSIPASTTTKTYQMVNDIFPNPERGFSTSSITDSKSFSFLSKTYLSNVRAKQMSLVRRVYTIGEFQNKPLSSTFLNNVATDFATARAAGVKLIVRVAYNFTSGGVDAPKSTILGHINQLKPILSANADVIAFQEAGFIGYWGEWHNSSNNLTNVTDEKDILNALLSALPSTRMVALRYPYNIRSIYNSVTPLIAAESYTGSNRSRTAHHDDCVLADNTNKGTYKDTTMSIDAQRAWLHDDSNYVAQGGETCSSDTNAAPYISCSYALKELEYLHYSQLNSEFEKNVLAGWQSGGCMPEITVRMGYHLGLVQSVVSEKIKPGGILTAKLDIKNDGFASAYNPRSVELILRNTSTKQEYMLPLQEDPRKWTAGSTSTIDVTAGLPTSIAPGTYSIFINLPDPESTIHSNPLFSIRLANPSVWESVSGYNILANTLVIDGSAAGSLYTGNNIFKQK